MRARNIKPDFFTDGELVGCSPLARLLFTGLWCLADREGRLKDKPLEIKMRILPADNCDPDELLKELEDSGRIVRYRAGELKLIQVKNFLKHQRPHKNEKDSELPEYSGNVAKCPEDSGKIGTNPPDPGSRIPDSGNLIPEEKPAASGPTSPGEAEPEEAAEPPVLSVEMLPDPASKEPRFHPVSQADVDRWAELYPAVDVMQSLRNMLGWLEGHPRKRSATPRGVTQRITSWLKRDQDRGGNRSGRTRASPRRDNVAQSQESIGRVFEEKRAGQAKVVKMRRKA